MLLPQELYPHIPRKVQLWTPHDVQTWFKTNSIQTKPSFKFQEQRFDGHYFLEVTPDYLLNKCGITSKLIMKKIIQWIEQQKDQFNQYVEDQNLNFENQESKIEKFAHESEQIPLQQNKENQAKNENCSLVVQKHYEAIMPYQQVKKWNKKRRSISFQKKAEHLMLMKQLQLKSNKFKSERETPSDIRHVESTYEICQQKLVFSYFFMQQLRTIELRGNGDIGRKKQAEVLIEQDSVSRNHSQILKLNSQFYLKDDNSRFGTFVQIGKDKRKFLQQGDVLNFEDQCIEIVSIKINKSKGMPNFDLKVRIFKNKESFANFSRKVVVLIGKKDRDITINSPNIHNNHAKIILENDNKLYLVKEQGQVFIKLKRQQLYRLQLHQQTILLGLQKVSVKLQKQRRPVTNISQFSLEKY